MTIRVSLSVAFDNVVNVPGSGAIDRTLTTVTEGGPQGTPVGSPIETPYVNPTPLNFDVPADGGYTVSVQCLDASAVPVGAPLVQSITVTGRALPSAITAV